MRKLTTPRPFAALAIGVEFKTCPDFTTVWRKINEWKGEDTSTGLFHGDLSTFAGRTVYVESAQD